MRKLLVNNGAVVLGAMFVLAFAACPADTGSSGNEAVLNGFQAIAGSLRVDGELGEEAIPASVWDTLTSRTGLTEEQEGLLDFDDTPDPVVVTFKVTASPKAAVTYAVARDNIIPQAGNFRKLSEPTPPLASDYAVYFKVVSGNKKVTNYYYIEVTGVTGAAPSSNTVIFNVKIGGQNAVTPSGSEVIGDVTLENYELPGAVITGTVTLELSKNNAGQTISWAKAGAAAAAPNDAAFTVFAPPASGNTLSAAVSSGGLAAGDKIYIKVVAADGLSVRYYGFTISAGNTARLAELSLAGTKVTRLGEPGTAWDAIASAGVFDSDTPAGGFALAASAADGGAIACAVTADRAAEPLFTPVNGTANVQLANGSFLYIKVTSANGSVIAVYGINIFLKTSVNVLYGQPEIAAGTAGAMPVLDSLWDTQNWIFNVSSPNQAEETLDPEKSRFLNAEDGPYSEIGYGHTESRIKAFWDDGGLYVYAEITFHDYLQWNATAPYYLVKRETLVTPDSGTAPDNTAHEYDSLEIFTNERVQTYQSGNYGVQYRIAPSPDGESAAGTGSRISGTDPADSSGHVEAFRGGSKYYTWIRKDGAGKELGYSIIAYIPWAFKGNANAVFGSDGKVSAQQTTGSSIGMELQLNAVTYDENAAYLGMGEIDALERAVLAWNGTGKPFQQVGSYGRVTLITGDLAARGIVRGARD